MKRLSATSWVFIVLLLLILIPMGFGINSLSNSDSADGAGWGLIISGVYVVGILIAWPITVLLERRIKRKVSQQMVALTPAQQAVKTHRDKVFMRIVLAIILLWVIFVLVSSAMSGQ